MFPLKSVQPGIGGQGAGLGNELIPWCRAFVGAQALGVPLRMPSFGRNPRRYGRHFGTPSWDWLQEAAMTRLLPRFEFDAEACRRHAGASLSETFRNFGEAHQLDRRSAFVVTTTGMWGGMGHIVEARHYARAMLSGSTFAARNLMQVNARLKPGLPVVGVHVRRGDFHAPLEPMAYQGKFNFSLSLDWYRRVAESLMQAFEGRLQFLIVSDDRPENLTPLTDGLPCVFTGDLPDSDCSDLLALANTDLLVCSISSYSIWAAFLSDAPYLWYAPQLTPVAEGRYGGIWAHEDGQRLPGSPTFQSIEAWASGDVKRPRGHPVGLDGRVPAERLVDAVQARLWDPRADLIRYGVVPLEASGA